MFPGFSKIFEKICYRLLELGKPVEREIYGRFILSQYEDFHKTETCYFGGGGKIVRIDDNTGFFYINGRPVSHTWQTDVKVGIAYGEVYLNDEPYVKLTEERYNKLYSKIEKYRSDIESDASSLREESLDTLLSKISFAVSPDCQDVSFVESCCNSLRSVIKLFNRIEVRLQNMSELERKLSMLNSLLAGGLNSWDRLPDDYIEWAVLHRRKGMVYLTYEGLLFYLKELGEISDGVLDMGGHILGKNIGSIATKTRCDEEIADTIVEIIKKDLGLS